MRPRRFYGRDDSIKGFLRRIIRASAVVALLAGSAAAADPSFDWSPLEEEAVSLLSRYIRIDTTNPPGNELKAAQFMKSILEREGIGTRIIESAPGRANFYARLRGDGSKKAVVLLHHMDVVPADGKGWKEPPFSGAVKHGSIWGRGAIDNKGGGIMQLMALLALKRQNVPLKADIILVGVADEEAGGVLGAGYLLDKHPELFREIAVVLNEGGGMRAGEDGGVRLYSVGVAEKVPLWLKLTASGAPGHAASPGPDQAVLKLIAALDRIARYQTPIKVVAEVQRFYADSAASAPANRREQYKDLRNAFQDPEFAAEFLKDRSNNARVRNTISITRLGGSEKINVIPGEASAEIDVRLLPGEEPQEFIAELRRVIADPSIEVEILLSRAAAVSPASPEALQAISDYAAANDPGAPVVFPMGTGFTDCHFFRAKGVPCIGFLPRRTRPSEQGMTHGTNERVAIAELKLQIRAMYDIVRKLAAD
jgi:acetylornithine deacetylase/succinyl-diaminopimelate desuccinylase-like protein